MINIDELYEVISHSVVVFIMLIFLTRLIGKKFLARTGEYILGPVAAPGKCRGFFRLPSKSRVGMHPGWLNLYQARVKSLSHIKENLKRA